MLNLDQTISERRRQMPAAGIKAPVPLEQTARRGDETDNGKMRQRAVRIVDDQAAGEGAQAGAAFPHDKRRMLWLSDLASRS
jgi:hypothetical protein